MINRKDVERLRTEYPEGTRIQLLCMANDPFPVLPGSEGTVTGVDDMGHILMSWDTGSSLSLIPEGDVFRVIERPSKDADA